MVTAEQWRSIRAGVSDRMLIFGLKQVRRYFTEPRVRAQARAAVEREIGEDTRVVVGHSLGSVVAYEALCAHPQWPVTDFVTLGFPLGMRSVVFDRLDPLPVAGRGVAGRPRTLGECRGSR